MDNVHGIDEKPWISKRKLIIKELADDKNLLLKDHRISLGCDDADSDEHLVEFSARLKEFVDKNNQEVKQFFMFNSAEERLLMKESRCKLKTYQLQLEHAKTMISERNYKVRYLTSLKTTRKEMLMRYLASTGHKETPITHSHHQRLMPNDRTIGVVLVIQIWHPPSKVEKVRLEREILFRADQNLTELRDQFKCPRDYKVPIDLSDDPDQQIEKVFHGELFKAGFFLIENTFYNDLRDPNNTDLSATILTWAEDKVTIVDENDKTLRVSRGVGPFTRKRMEDTSFEDLETIRLGYPYLYCHQGNCEHLFTISDIRYVPLDRLESIHYPVISASSVGRKEYSLKCFMCRLRPPHWYTRHNSRLPVDPFFFCENCFKSFNYDQNRRKIGHFQAFLYTSALGIPDSLVMGTSNSTPSNAIAHANHGNR